MLAVVAATWLVAQAPAPAAGETTTQALVDAADVLLRNANDDFTSYDAALTKYVEAIAAGYPRGKIDGRRAEAYLRLGDVAVDDDDKLALYEKGLAAANEGVRFDKRCTDCWFFRAANLARINQTKGIIASLLGLDEVKRSFHEVLAIDPKCVETKLALAHIDAAVPTLDGSGVLRAEKAFRDVVAQDAHFGRAALDLAELLVEQGKRTEARRLARDVIDDVKPRHPGEHRKFDVKRAKQLLGRAR